MKVYINSIIYNRSLADGPGVRTVVFFQGCDIRCEGCHNPSTWNIDNGKLINENIRDCRLLPGISQYLNFIKYALMNVYCKSKLTCF